jgi:hypothetical protein
MKNLARHLRILAPVLVAAGLLSDCGGSSGYGGGGGSSSGLYTIGGTVTGLDSGTSVTLQNNAGDNTTVSADGSFAFPTGLAYTSSYAVTVLTQPTGRTCFVVNGAGTVPTTNVTSVTVACTSNTNAPGHGGLVITEVMAHPAGSPEADREWFEVLNPSGVALDIGGMVVTRGLSDLFVVPAGTSIPGGTFFVFAANSSGASNGGLPGVDVNYGSSLQLVNTGFGLALTVAVGLVDAVSFSTAMPSGASRNLKATAMDASSNDVESNWCTSTTTYGTDNNKGTPRSTSDCP